MAPSMPLNASTLILWHGLGRISSSAATSVPRVQVGSPGCSATAQTVRVTWSPAGRETLGAIGNADDTDAVYRAVGAAPVRAL